METKKCYKCGEVKAVSEFYKNKGNKDGLTYQCKECKKKYYQVNREHELDRYKKYRQENKEKIKNRRRTYYQNNKKKIKNRRKEYMRQYMKDDVDKLGDRYIKQIVYIQTNGLLKHKDIPEELIELKRNNLILKRKIKDNGKEATNL